ncbi:helix-turn-helix domain-containing protein [Reinekea sp.]|jgi:transcriptional regulator with XRE-family HTH domain|uniref:helix-turn-helix domain-containing protein n=1 Tax=Reinekea sp. TaxID=1970455 RepID=UPI003988DBA2
MNEIEINHSTDVSDLESSFAERLRSLIGDGSVSAFARKVALSESLIRKYLKGSEPSLARANQIAQQFNVSLEWLATGCGYMYRQAEVVDSSALALARALVTSAVQPNIAEHDQLTIIVSVYQHLRAHKKADGYLDELAARQFVEHLIDAKAG